MGAKHFKKRDDSRDQLTGLAGRDEARSRLTEWRKDGQTFHALLVGLRRFEALNLAFGSAAGDTALVDVAARIRQLAAAELDGIWFAARVGGSRFLLLSKGQSSRERWQLFAGQLAEAIARPIAAQSGTLRLSPRIAMLRGLPDEGPDSTLERLGQAMELLLAQSGRRVLWADGEGTRPGRSATLLEADLLRAIDGDEIEIFYQPQFSCADDRLVGAEALARWNHPELGRIGAGALFAIAERADHVAQLSGHIAHKALAGATKWPGDLRLSLNITPGELAFDSFAVDFIAQVKRSRFPAWRLTLEVTEQVQLADVRQAAIVLADLSQAGIKIALDDFGAGFCNFRYLKLLPLHYLKLDRSMIEGLAGDGRSLAVLRAIIATGRALDLQVVAEGVESEAQRILISEEGCASYQGYLKAQPMSGTDFLELARS